MTPDDAFRCWIRSLPKERDAIEHERFLEVQERRRWLRHLNAIGWHEVHDVLVEVWGKQLRKCWPWECMSVRKRQVELQRRGLAAPAHRPSSGVPRREYARNYMREYRALARSQRSRA